MSVRVVFTALNLVQTNPEIRCVSPTRFVSAASGSNADWFYNIYCTIHTIATQHVINIIIDEFLWLHASASTTHVGAR